MTATVEFKLYHGWKQIAAQLQRHPDTVRRNWRRWKLPVSFRTGRPSVTQQELSKWSKENP